MRAIHMILGLMAASGGAMGAIAQTPPPATAAAQLKVGATIYDTAGAEVGTVDSMTADSVVVSTGTNKVAIPPTSFGPGANGPVLAATRAQLDAAAGQAAGAAKAALTAKLVPGAEIRGSGGTVIGTVKTIEGDLVLVETPKGEVRVPSAGFTVGASGLVLGMSAADFDAAVAAAKPAA